MNTSKLYMTIYEDIKGKIASGEYASGTKLPSEHEFCVIYDTSRGTIRNALDLLVEEGLVNRQPGKGVYVLDNNAITFSFGGLVSFKEASESSGQKFLTTVPYFEEITITNKLHERTKLPLGETAYCLHRVRELGGERIILDINYFLKEKVEGLTKEIAERSIYDYIEQQLGHKIGFAQRVIQVEPATAKDREHLIMKSYGFVVVVKNYVYMHDGSLFEYTESRHHPERFVFTDFARRR
ncbi:trehalose operon repressor [Paenibacillus alvei]|uniref:Trehalose operon repressor n=1 Tax=Paenibacillus alvei TaxID=44250 RepID=A0ABT4GY57_PAEAL|nr:MULTISPECIES: trehalose operon repressor [Paenibacillus]EJW19652.1 trehalose operon transcriptional repressor [Paenibacillus alvei DSM 29]MCY7485030.1 trehalose operon repressor [Paenibacillus alvei]MCY9542008.1 trehalose operon repressor [Paenibacillus alvei]MCY9706778.1 trehalose operon repressor [Paenibacillus alvei]MCY9735222.1 trehalose operon repressor [Paenibacillus alvei]